MLPILPGHFCEYGMCISTHTVPDPRDTRYQTPDQVRGDRPEVSEQRLRRYGAMHASAGTDWPGPAFGQYWCPYARSPCAPARSAALTVGGHREGRAMTASEP